MIERILDPIFRPLLELGFFWAIMIISFSITLIITLVYKFTTDQNLMKKLKGELKVMQKELKQLTHNPEKAMVHQKKMMSKNMTYMKHSMKSTLFTFIPIILIFGWLNAHMAYIPITPDTEFSVSAEFKSGTFGEVSLESLPELNILSGRTQTITNNRATWQLSGVAGAYQLKLTFGNRVFDKDLLISVDQDYAVPEKQVRDSDLTKIVIHNEKVRPLGKLSILGWNPGWLGTYIIFSLIFSLSLRKIMKIS